MLDSSSPHPPVPPVLAFGLAVIEKLHGIRTPWLDQIFLMLTHLGDEPFVLAAVPAAFVLARRRWAGQFALSIMAIAWITEVLKLCFREPRPIGFVPGIALVEAPGYSLPSGHSAFSVVFWGLIAARIGTPKAWVAAALLALGIGTSRVYLGAHFPTDVLAGWLLGGAGLMFALRFLPAISERIVALPRSTRLGLALFGPLILLVFGATKEIISILASVQGALMGLAVGDLVLSRPEELTQGALPIRILRVALAIALTLGVSIGIKAMWTASGEDFGAWRWLRYVVVGFTATTLAPLACQRLRY
jgi:undecaprenyl-diphosphatase